MKRALIVLCFIAAPAAAEINMADSVEWQTIDADVVVRGFVTAVTKSADGFTVTVQITESIKGGVKKSLQANVHMPDAARWNKDHTDLLLFLDTDKKHGHVLRPIHGSDHSAFELGTHRAFTTSFGVLEKPTEVLAAVRTAARSTATLSHKVDVPWDTPAMKALWGGSSVFMMVPVDHALEQLARGWIASKSVSDREEGARALALFRSDSNIAAMKSLLGDAGFSETSTNGGPTVKRYIVRVAAHEALESWHVAHKTPTLEEPLKK